MSKAVILFFSLTQAVLFPAVHQSGFFRSQEEVLRQRCGDVGCMRHHSPPGGVADSTQRAVPEGAPHGLEHMCLHYSGHR